MGYGEAGFTGGLGGGGKDGENINLLFNIFMLESNSKLEIGLGLSYIWYKKYNNFYSGEYDFAFCFGYRYQPKYGGFFFRAGISRFVPGGGLNISLGYTF